MSKFNPYSGGTLLRPGTSKQAEAIFDQNGQFNPVIDGSRAYTEDGQMNVATKQEGFRRALEASKHVAHEHARRISAAARPTDEAEQEHMIRQVQAAMKTAEGSQRVAEESAMPIKQILDYAGWTRQVLNPKSLKPGERFALPRDIRAQAFVVASDGMTAETRIRSGFQQIPEYMITSFTAIDVASVYEINFDVLDRMQETAAQAIMLEEDKRTVALLDRASTAINRTTEFAVVGPAAFEGPRREIERHRLLARRFMMNRIDASDVFTVMAPDLDMVSQRELQLRGVFAQYLGCDVMVTAGLGQQSVVPSGTIYCMTDADSLGVFGTRIQLFSEAYNRLAFGEFVKGFAYGEKVGSAVGNYKAVAKSVRV